MISDLQAVALTCVGRVLDPSKIGVGINSDLQGCREARVAGASHGPTYKDVGKPVLQEHLTGRPTRM